MKNKIIQNQLFFGFCIFVFSFLYAQECFSQIEPSTPEEPKENYCVCDYTYYGTKLNEQTKVVEKGSSCFSSSASVPKSKAFMNPEELLQADSKKDKSFSDNLLNSCDRILEYSYGGMNYPEGKRDIRIETSDAMCEQSEGSALFYVSPKSAEFITDAMYCGSEIGFSVLQGSCVSPGGTIWKPGYVILSIENCRLSNTESENMLTSYSSLNKLKADSIPKLIGLIIKTAMTILGTIAFSMFLCGGILYMTSRGGEQKGEGMKILVWATLGTVVILSSYVILQYIFKAF